MAPLRRVPILVTGGAGYIGAHTCKALWQQGYLPLVVDNLSTGHRSACQWGSLFIADLRNKSELRSIFLTHHPVAVIHFAGFSSVAESMRHPYEYYDNNVSATLNLLQVMAEVGCPSIVFSSTCAIYGEAQSPCLDESHPQNPINPYGRSKWMIEMLMREGVQAYGLKALALRYFNASGADPEGDIGENHQPETHIIPLVLQTALGLRAVFSIYGNDYATADGTCVRDYIHVSDLAQAHLLALKHLDSQNEGLFLGLNLGTGQGHSVGQIVKYACQVTQKSIPTKIESRRPGDPPVLVANPQKAQEILGWTPRYPNVKSAIAHAWQWMQAR